MANDKKKMVEAITAQEVDFAQWYTDICTKAELVEYSSVKGFVVLRPSFVRKQSLRQILGINFLRSRNLHFFGIIIQKTVSRFGKRRQRLIAVIAKFRFRLRRNRIQYNYRRRHSTGKKSRIIIIPLPKFEKQSRRQ